NRRHPWRRLLHFRNQEPARNDLLRSASERESRPPRGVVLLMISFTKGNLLESGTDAVVNTVNTVGIMGKGIALMFKEAFPANFREYEAACKRGSVRTGEMFVTERPSMLGAPRWIINFPTKQHWRGKARLEWIKAGLEDLRRVIRENNIRSIALPPLGCGNGGLDWRVVRPLVEEALCDLQDVDI